MTVRLAPAARQQFFDANGNPYSGAKLFTYDAGTTTKRATFTASNEVTANTNPIILDTSGRTPYGVWLTQGVAYKFVLAIATDTDPPTSPLFSEDNISGVNDAAVSLSQWVPSSLLPLSAGGSSFTVPGDQTAVFHVGRRIRLTMTAGVRYGTIISSAYSTSTLVFASMDGTGVIDSGLSAADLAVITEIDTSLPPRIGTLMLHVQDQRATGVAGGASIVGSNTRVLNTVVVNTIPGASLSANMITLPKGVYRVWASAPCHQGGAHRLQLYNAIPNVAPVGPNESSVVGSAGSQSSARLQGARFVLNIPKDYFLLHYIQTAKATDGLGLAVSLGLLPEVYAEVIVMKEQ